MLLNQLHFVLHFLLVYARDWTMECYNSGSAMLIQSDPILAQLTAKVRRHGQDRSRHVLCPQCRVRTKLYLLGDGRKKCSACGVKFHAEKKADAAKLKQYADLLLCFCLNVTAKKASDLTGYHYRLASAVYDHVRTLLASQTLTPGKMRLLRSTEACDRNIHDSEFCSRCRGRFACKGRQSGDAPIFGVKILASGVAFIDPLEDEEASFRFDQPSRHGHATFSNYAGFICRGKFHRFTDNERLSDGAERLWAWMSERLRAHHGIWKKNAGLYLKELEWKYNNRSLSTEIQAQKIADLLPEDFLSTWRQSENISLDLVQSNA
jgi:hypothetical protein